MGRPRAFGTINFCKLNIEPRIVDRIEIEKGNSNNHVEISGFKLDKRLTIINVYNNPSSSLELLKETLLEVKDYIDESENILILGDFNHELKLGNQLESLLLQSFEPRLFSHANRQQTLEQLSMEYSVELTTMMLKFLFTNHMHHIISH
ncbi:hypothetical protein PVAND_007230 [Polypedilum vanderplanki]|uniref:Endonuclease/exonuclease/phosphatase domain-containing protein n=1 Tax=Polypedilum vanderplanki TaxID=319348 RepID=A0A9J6C6J6_POLVA|nr:hypothetical protein PVAND_007230 [Polypedilum vanderplanki]